MNRLGLPLLLSFIVAAMVGLFVVGQRQPDKPKPPENKEPRVETNEQSFPSQGQEHIQPGQEHAAYNSNPPTSGPHYGSPAPWGIKDGGLPDETLIHNLEHGGIVISYKPDIGDEQINRLKDIFRAFPPSQQFNTTKAILVPRPNNDSPISVTAWTFLMNLDSPDEAKIKQFYLDHVDKGPELVP
jgi:hypothetical protein